MGSSGVMVGEGSGVGGEEKKKDEGVTIEVEEVEEEDDDGTCLERGSREWWCC